MKGMGSIKSYFSRREQFLWLGSVGLIVLTFLLFRQSDYFSLVSSLIGVTALILCAKGNPLGQLLMIVFCLMYAAISLGYSYYGELLTYLLMCLPMAVFSFAAWIRHPYQGNHAQVTVYRITRRDLGVMVVLTAAVTTLFYFLLSALHTVNLLPSTISVTTSFLAAYLTYKRSPYYALGYAANDVVLIILWVLASLSDPAYLSVVICFVVFLVNDLYAFFNWRQMERHQAAGAAAGGKEDASCSGI